MWSPNEVSLSRLFITKLFRYLLLNAITIAALGVNQTYSAIEPGIHLSGFMTVGSGFTDADAFPVADDPEDREDAVNSNGETPKFLSNGDRYILNNDLDFNAYTRGGMQIEFDMLEDLVATMQIVSSGAVDNYDPNLAWFYLNYQLNPSTRLLAGRFRVPIYLASSFLDVGFAYPWITPPVEVYTMINMNNMTGFSTQYAAEFYDRVWLLHLFAGTSDYERITSVTQFRDLFGLASSYGNEHLTLRASYMQYNGNFSGQGEGLQDDLAQGVKLLTDLGFSNIVEYMDFTHTKTSFTTLSYELNYQGFKSLGEWAYREQESILADVEGWYVTMGYQINNWFPHITFSRRDERNEDERLPPQLPALRAVSEVIADLLVDTVNDILEREDNESSAITIGVKYDLTQSVVAKLEWMRVKNLESSGFFEFATQDQTNTIVSFSLETVF